jgi:hypothetical protein
MARDPSAKALVITSGGIQRDPTGHSSHTSNCEKLPEVRL